MASITGNVVPGPINLPIESLVEMLKHLNPEEIARMSRTDKLWKKAANESYLWRELLVRDFGEKSGYGVNPEDCKDVYVQNYSKLKDLIYCKMPLGWKLLEEAKMDRCLKSFGGVVSSDKMTQYINNLSVEKLQHVFNESALMGVTIVTKAIMESERFDDIEVNGKYGLGHAFAGAAGQGNIEILDLIIQSPRFNDVSENGEWGFGTAFFLLSRNGNIAGMELLMKNAKFKKIDYMGDSGLIHAFISAAFYNQEKAMKLILTIPIPGEYILNMLGGGLIHACQRGNIEPIKLILNHKEANLIDPNGEFGFGRALIASLEHGGSYVEDLLLLINHEKFSLINTEGEYGLGRALFEAAKYSFASRKIQLLAKHPGYNEIEPNGPYGFGAALLQCVGVDGEYETVKQIVDHPRFKEISEKGEFGLIEVRKVFENARSHKKT